MAGSLVKSAEALPPVKQSRPSGAGRCAQQKPFESLQLETFSS